SRQKNHFASIEFEADVIDHQMTVEAQKDIAKLDCGRLGVSVCVHEHVQCNDYAANWLCTRSAVLACEARASIKPGRKPQDQSTTDFSSPRMRVIADRDKSLMILAASCRPFHGLAI